MEIDITDKRFGLLTAISQSHYRGNRSYWLCRCDCGVVKAVSKAELTRRSGAAKSCGCLKKANGVKHGRSYSTTYKKWKAMFSRVRNSERPRNECYRGIKVCKRWRKFENFLADMGEAPEGLTLERINNHKGYSPANCKWATWKEQSNNRSNIRLITFLGKTQSMTAWAAELGAVYSSLVSRLNRLPVSEALSIYLP